MGNLMGKESTSGKIRHLIKVSLKKERNMGLESGKNLNTDLTKDFTKTTKRMAKVPMYGLQAIHM